MKKILLTLSLVTIPFLFSGCAGFVIEEHSYYHPCPPPSRVIIVEEPPPVFIYGGWYHPYHPHCWR
jgi:hypothetical protein